MFILGYLWSLRIFPLSRLSIFLIPSRIITSRRRLLLKRPWFPFCSRSHLISSIRTLAIMRCTTLFFFCLQQWIITRISNKVLRVVLIFRAAKSKTYCALDLATAFRSKKTNMLPKKLIAEYAFQNGNQIVGSATPLGIFPPLLPLFQWGFPCHSYTFCILLR